MDIGTWLRQLGLGQYEQSFRDNDIDGDVLADLTADDLSGLGVVSIGHRRKLLAAIAALRTASPSIPAPLTQAATIPSGTAPPCTEAERRQLTVMFIDLVGSTALAARLDPEDMREVIAAYHQCVARTVARFDGLVAKYMGDGVLAYFGYPRAHEDDAEQAVRAGLELVTAVSTLRPRPGIGLQGRVGIATGLVVVGDLIGTGAAQEQAVVGETPNLAARLQAVAEPGGVIIAAATRRLIGGLFEYEDLGKVEAKGFPEPVPAWRVCRESALDSRFEALRSGEVSLIGRDEEIELLLRHWDHAQGGEGQVLLMAGEPGIGKSRLITAFQDRIAQGPHLCLRYFCSPHHQDSALHPAVAHLERAAGFAHEDTPEIRLGKLKILLARTGSSNEDVALLSELLSLPAANHHPPLNLTPQRRKAGTFAALLRQLEELSRLQPVLMIFEDAHWSDPTSREWLDLVVERISDLPVLLVVTFRPEFQPPWVGQAHVTMLMLNRLSRREGAALAQRIAGETELPSDLLAEIVERTDGVPLFVEELTKAVLDAGRATGEGVVAAVPSNASAVPATLHASLLARLDRLSPATREIAQIGSAIGREFSYELLADVAIVPASTLAKVLDQLAASGLVLQRGSPPEASYLFKHALIQDTAYSTLLRGRRQDWHARIATALQKRLPDIATSRPELLARHLAAAGQPAQAVQYWTAAGERALVRAAHHEAAAFYERALAALEAQAKTPEVLTAMIDVRKQLHQALYPIGRLQPARANLAQAERSAAQLGDRMRLARVRASQIYLLAATGDLAGAIAAGERALVGLAETDDLDAVVGTRLMLARALYAAGQYSEAIAHARDVVALLEDDVERGALGGMNQTISAHVWLTLFHTERGEFEAGAAEGETATRLAADPRCTEHDMVWVRIGLGRLQVVRGDFVRAIGTLAPALPLCEGDLVIYFSRVASSLGRAYAGAGRIEEGVALLQRADERARVIGFAFGHALVLAQLGEALLLADDFEQAQEIGRQAVETAQRWGERGNEAWARCLLGDIAASRRARQEGQAQYQKAVAIAEELEMAPVLARCSAGLNRLGSRGLSRPSRGRP
ncbi:adenylate/guanylate cyclase domain-containing protein [Microvirga yunnanensis]|uniref:adenylate/guanylate cyclase domain-containing protein n=1 Tax=Microvirga yunnanensis TaxID=2953740 RepID=UPI0021C789A8|nr:adenylate/guanylate cyclase domain-containing protein [Microvirga sp. HBU65207]